MPNMRRLSECKAQLLEAAGYVIKRKTGTARILGGHTIAQVHHEERLLVGALEEFSGNTIEIRAACGDCAYGEGIRANPTRYYRGYSER